MKVLVAAILVSLLTASCTSGTRSVAAPSPAKFDPSPFLSGGHDASLAGTWKGINSTEYRLVFKGDGSLEVQLHEQTVNKGYWRTESKHLEFVLLSQDDPGTVTQSCAYRFDEEGHLFLDPDQFAGDRHPGYRKLTPAAGGPV